MMQLLLTEQCFRDVGFFPATQDLHTYHTLFEKYLAVFFLLS